jgi:flagellar protein FlaG
MQGRHDLAVGGNTLPQRRREESPEANDPSVTLHEAVENASAYARRAGRKLDFSIEEELNRTIVTISDRLTGEVIRRLPMEEMLAIAGLLSDVQAPGDDAVLKGVFFDQDT